MSTTDSIGIEYVYFSKENNKWKTFTVCWTSVFPYIRYKNSLDIATNKDNYRNIFKNLTQITPSHHIALRSDPVYNINHVLDYLIQYEPPIIEREFILYSLGQLKQKLLIFQKNYNLIPNKNVTEKLKGYLSFTW